ncbi:MAG TPA: hypothetical protein PKN33_15035 [Phycisphaerae bacterium]|nr:hypothetical protein [Phycisphaerae bacterium]
MFGKRKSGDLRKSRFYYFNLLLGYPPTGVPLAYWEFSSRKQKKLRVIASVVLVAALALLLSLVTYPGATLNAPPAIKFGFGAMGIACSWMTINTIRRTLRQFSDHLIEREFMVCFGCGYDLRNLTSDRCPECGDECDHEKLHSRWNDWLDLNKTGASG